MPHQEQPDRPLPEHVPSGDVTDATVEAVGTLSEALEVVEECRGLLYAFHRRTGTADHTLQQAVALLHQAGHDELATRIETELVGRNVLHGRWTFQIVEEYDDTYWSIFRDLEADARRQLVGGRRHLHEAEMKESKRTPGRPDHTAAPDDSGTQGADA